MVGDFLRRTHFAKIRFIFRNGSGFRLRTLRVVVSAGTAAPTFFRFSRLPFRLGPTSARCGRNTDGLAVAAVTHYARLQLHIVFQGTVWSDFELLQDGVIGPDCLLGRNLAIGDETQEANKRALVFGIVDFSAK